MKKWYSFSRREFDELCRFIFDLSSEFNIPLNPELSFDEESLEAMININAPFSYFWVTDIRKMKIEKIHGIKKCLGYEEETFDLFASLAMIHPVFNPFVIEYARTVYKFLSQESFRKQAIKCTYHIQFPVKNMHGEYYLVSQYSRPYAFDEKGNMVANYNLYIITKEYSNENIVVRPRLRLNIPGYLAKEENNLVQAVTKQLNRKFRLLTKAEKMIAIHHIEGLQNKEIAEQTETTKSNIAMHNKNILRKANAIFPTPFTDAKEVAKYYLALGFLDD